MSDRQDIVPGRVQPVVGRCLHVWVPVFGPVEQCSQCGSTSLRQINGGSSPIFPPVDMDAANTPEQARCKASHGSAGSQGDRK